MDSVGSERSGRRPGIALLVALLPQMATALLIRHQLVLTEQGPCIAQIVQLLAPLARMAIAPMMRTPHPLVLSVRGIWIALLVASLV